jgi:hypothetical protein
MADVPVMRRVRRRLDPAELGRIFPRALEKAARPELKANGRRLVDRFLAERVRASAAVGVEPSVELRVAARSSPATLTSSSTSPMGGPTRVPARRRYSTDAIARGTS